MKHGSDYHEPSCLWRCVLWAAVVALFVLVLLAPWWAA